MNIYKTRRFGLQRILLKTRLPAKLQSSPVSVRLEHRFYSLSTVEC